MLYNKASFFKAIGDGLRVWLHSRRLNCEVVMPVSFSTSLVLNLFCSLIALRYCPSVSAISSPLFWKYSTSAAEMQQKYKIRCDRAANIMK